MEPARLLIAVVVSLIPMAAVMTFFHFAILRHPLRNQAALFAGTLAVVAGMWMIVTGMEMGVYRVGEQMAVRLSAPSMGYWILIFPFLLGYAATMAEPSLIALADKAQEVTSGGLRSFTLKNIVACGVGVGVMAGVHRIQAGGKLWIYLVVGYLTIVALTRLAPREVVPIAHDSGVVTTSTVTVPVIFAMGLGLAKARPGGDMLVDGFGLIAIASLSPVLFVLLYAVAARFSAKLKSGRR
jgi:hypothetical protein